jgi:hypothetical protein
MAEASTSFDWGCAAPEVRLSLSDSALSKQFSILEQAG